MASSSSTDAVPTWSGDPTEFESYSIACRWFEKSLKDNEKKQAASRLWARLTGPAKAVVRHLNPDEFEALDGVSKLLSVLRQSPLQQLPVPDSFKRLDTWHQLKRGAGESIPQLLVREEDLFVQLQAALRRARQDQSPAPNMSGVGHAASPGGMGPPSTPSQSPVGGAGRGRPDVPSTAQVPTQPEEHVKDGVGDFFSDELRG